MQHVKFILASASPRRKALLEQIGLTFETRHSHIAEPPYAGTNPEAYARALASMKSEEISTICPDALVLGSDTIVVVDEEVLGKPKDREEAQSMLHKLSNRRHEVITAYALQHRNLHIDQVYHVSTQVHFKHLNESDIQKYIESGAPFDKAGSYGIQDFSSVFVDYIDGCFYNVVGLPLSDFHSKLTDLLKQHQIVLD